MYTVPKDFLTTVNTTLHTGETYKGYSSLCAVLNEPKLYGNSKAAQLKEWSRYFTVNQHSSYSWEITSINILPTVKTNSKYLYLSTALWSHLLHDINHTGEISISKKVLYGYMGIPYADIQPQSLYALGWENVKQYTSVLSSEVRYKMLYSGLKSLNVKKLHSYKIINEHGNYRISTEDEYLLLKDVKSKLKKEYKEKRMPTAFNSSFIEDYTKRCVDVLGYYGISAITISSESIPAPEDVDITLLRREFRERLKVMMQEQLKNRMDESIVIALNDFFWSTPQHDELFKTKVIKDKIYIT